MSELKQTGSSVGRNPLIWIALAIIGLIIFVFVSGDRVSPVTDIAPGESTESPDSGETSGTIERSLLVPPGMRARQDIEQLRNDGKPYPLTAVFEKAQAYRQEGSLADAHIMFFFAAREDHVPAIMKMAEMSDPMLFRAESSLLDSADAIQAYKWYRKAASMGYQPASERVSSLQRWANTEAELGNPYARQLLLNFR